MQRLKEIKVLSIDKTFNWTSIPEKGLVKETNLILSLEYVFEGTSVLTSITVPQGA